jgi:hypothetical protein
VDGYSVYTTFPEREFYWETGYKIIYIPWEPGQPDNFLLEQFNMKISANGCDDANDRGVYNVLCEIHY